MSTIIENRISKYCQAQPEEYLPRILCVDDDPDFQTMMDVQLKNYAVDLHRSFFGMQGISTAIQTAPDLILMDLAMPNGNGEYFLECIKDNCTTNHIPIIVLTGMRNPEIKKRVMNAGADLFLHKPVEFDDLFHHLSRFIDIKKR